MADKVTPPPQPTQMRNERSPEFVESYSNNVQFEVSCWDLKIIFGQLDQATGTVQQHTAITFPWSMVKLAVQALRLQVQSYETFYGPIKITDDMLPTPPPVPTGELAKNPKIMEIYENAKKLRDDFIAEIKKQQGS